MQQPKTEPTQTIPLDLMQWAELPNDAFVRLPTVKRLYGVSCATIWRGVKNGTIPKPRKLSQRCTAWNVGLIRASLAEKDI
jgi:predicted DNA-binding transcriptional regulator AlpA